MPTRSLPARPNLDQLKRQAKDLLAAHAARDPAALQRLREFHPRFRDAADRAIGDAPLTWSDALFAIAREYGYSSWARLKARVEGPAPAAGQAPHHERIGDPVFRRAVELVDDGDADALAQLFDEHPDLADRRVVFEGGNYFRNPSLLAFVPENPIRNDALPPNIVEIARLILDRGAAAHRRDVEEALELVASGRVPREAGVQGELIELLTRHGPDPAGALRAAQAHGEFAAAETLLACGAAVTLPVAAALGDADAVKARLAAAGPGERHLALALAAQHGRTEVLRLLLEAGEDPDRYNPIGAHAHSTPLHQAAAAGHAAAVRLLLDHGARDDLKDTLWNGTALDWARHAGREGIADELARRRG